LPLLIALILPHFNILVFFLSLLFGFVSLFF